MKRRDLTARRWWSGTRFFVHMHCKHCGIQLTKGDLLPNEARRIAEDHPHRCVDAKRQLSLW